MLYPKFTQRYLAAIVLSLIVALGVSSLFLVYSLYFRRSPLLVESLKRTESTLPSIKNVKSKEKQPLNTKFTDRTDRADEPSYLETIVLKKGSDDRLHYNDTQLNRTSIHSWESKTNYADLDDGSYSDTIYIDDFEKNRTNFFNIDKPQFRSDSPTQIGYTGFEETTKARMLKSHYNKLMEEEQSNLDALFDRNRDSSENFNISEDDDDADDIDDSTVYGSGSGDFEDKIFNYDIPTIGDFPKDWENQDRLMRYGLQQNTESPRINNRLKKNKKIKHLKTSGKIQKPIGRKANRSAIRTLKKYRLGINAEERSLDLEKSQFAARIKSEPTSSLNINSHWTIGKDRAKLSPENRSNKRPRKQGVLKTKTTKTTTVAQKLNTSYRPSDQVRLVTKPSLRYAERDSEIKVTAQTGSIQNKATGSDAQMRPATWVETRTRRILGNVRKSEERSRQLLLCEEAGGGELCRMLFKGHTSE